ncbi:hypothetical protein BJY04DRAFT_169911 [Aspergillus karnatakaensis]|uniref:uncharacterized protein n=1 Tax=Aspergillus karnatakaensis TaxID=1810916 RepID=UPI003CCD9736
MPSERLAVDQLHWSYHSVALSPDDTVTIAHNMDSILNNTLETMLHNIAASVTKSGRDRSDIFINGTAFVSEVYVHVNWVWLCLPATVVLLTLVFLVLTVQVNKTQGGELWKSSILPVLYHGLYENLLSDEEDYRTASRMEACAQAVDVKLQSSSSVGRLLLR